MRISKITRVRACFYVCACACARDVNQPIIDLFDGRQNREKRNATTYPTCTSVRLIIIELIIIVFNLSTSTHTHRINFARGLYNLSRLVAPR